MTLGMIFGIPFTLLIFACPILEIGKIELFSRTNGALTYDTNVEYTYLVLSLIAPSAIILVYFCKCSFGDNASPTTIKAIVVTFMICSIGISIAYTIFTMREMGNIPFGCPSDYNYTSPQVVETACQVRAANFISMWAFIFFLIINVLLFLFGKSPLNEKYERKDDGYRDYRDISDLFVTSKSQVYRDVGGEVRKSVTSAPHLLPTSGSDSSSGPFSPVELGQQQREGSGVDLSGSNS